MFRKFMVSLVIFALLSCSVVAVFADSDELISSWNYISGSATEFHLYETDASSNSNYSAVAQTFNATVDYYLAEVVVWMQKSAGTFAVDDVVSCRVEGVGADGLSGSPNGTVYAQAVNHFHLRDEIAYLSPAEYSFSFNLTYEFVPDAKYALVIYISSESDMYDAKYLKVFLQGTGSSHQGQMCYFSSSAWTEWPTYDLFHEVWGSEDGSLGTEPTGGSTTEVDDTISSLMWWFIYLIVMLAPAWFLGVYCKMGKWGFIMGIGVGAGVGYAFLTGFPLWLLIVVVIAEVGLAYQSLSSGG